MTVTLSNEAGLISNLQEAMKYQYPKAIAEQFDKTVKLYKSITKVKWGSGREQKLPFRSEWNRAVAAGAENGGLPPTGRSTIDAFTLTPKKITMASEISLESILRSRGDKQAMVSQVTEQMENVKTGLNKELNRMFNSIEGKLGTIASISTTAITMAAPEYAENFMVGDLIAILDPNDSYSVMDVSTVTAVNKTTYVVTTADDISSGVAAADVVFRAIAGAGQAAYGYDIKGLAGIIDDTTFGINTTFQGQTRTGSAPLYEGHVMQHSTPGTNRTLTPQLMMQAFNKTRGNSAFEAPDQLWCHYSMTESYIDWFRGLMQFQSGGKGDPFVKPEFHGVPLTEDNDCLPEKLYFWVKETIKWYEQEPLHAWDPGGGPLQRLDIPGLTTPKTNLYFRMLIFGEMGCTAPNANTCLADITATFT